MVREQKPPHHFNSKQKGTKQKEDSLEQMHNIQQKKPMKPQVLHEERRVLRSVGPEAAQWSQHLTLAEDLVTYARAAAL